MRTCVTVLASLLILTATAAAKPKKPAKPEPPKVEYAAVAEMMGKFTWGMTVNQVLAILEEELREKYKLQIEKTRDDYVKNQLKQKSKEEIEAIRKASVKFEGQKTGWDVSIVQGEFGHKDNEEMLLFEQITPEGKKQQQRFYFFVDGKLWKIFTAMDMESFKDKKFLEFVVIMGQRFGQPEIHTKPDAEQIEQIDYVFWKSPAALLRAIDLMRFYAQFCLAVSDPTVEEWIGARRLERNPTKAANAAGNKMVDSVLEDKTTPTKVDNTSNDDVIDRITKGQK